MQKANSDTVSEIDQDWVPDGFAVHRVDTNGVRLSAAVGGSGPVMVLLHGWPQTGRTWRKVTRRLAERYTVIVPDLRGTGASERPAGGYAKTNQAADMRGLLRALDLGSRAVVVGHDIGAMVALGWALRYPDDVAALILLDAALPGLGLEELMNVANGGMWHFGFFMAPAVPEMLMEGHQLEFFTQSFQGLGTSGTFTKDDIEFYAHAYTGKDRLRGGFEHYRTLLEDGRENRELLPAGLAMPVLAIGGRDSMEEAVGEPLRDHAADLTIEIAPSAHFIQEEIPVWLVDTILDFVGRKTAAASADHQRRSARNLPHGAITGSDLG